MNVNLFPEYDYNQIRRCCSYIEIFREHGGRGDFFFKPPTRKGESPMPTVYLEGVEYTPDASLSEWNRMEYILRTIEGHFKMQQEWNERSKPKS